MNSKKAFKRNIKGEKVLFKRSNGPTNVPYRAENFGPVTPQEFQNEISNENFLNAPGPVIGESTLGKAWKFFPGNFCLEIHALKSASDWLILQERRFDWLRPPPS